MSTDARTTTTAAPQPSHRDPDEVFGRSKEWVRWLLVALGTLGDGAAFYIVVGFVFNQGPALILLFSAGFASISIGLAHAVGTGWARLRSADPKANRPLWIVCLACWLFLGLVAFLVRLVQPGAKPQSGVGFNAAASNAASSPMPALLFAALFFASGVCAICAAYNAFNPLFKTLRRAVRRLRWAAAKEASSTSAVTLAEQDIIRYSAERKREHARWLAARQQATAHMSELQNYARYHMAVARKNPSATEGLTKDGPRPVLPPPVLDAATG